MNKGEVAEDLDTLAKGTGGAAKKRLLELSAVPETAAVVLSLLLSRVPAKKRTAHLREVEAQCRTLLKLPSKLELPSDDEDELEELAGELDEKKVATARALRRYNLLLHPDGHGALFGWAVHLQFQEEDLEGALAAFRDGYARFPNDEAFNRGLGTILVHRFSKLEEGLPFLCAAAALDPLDASSESSVASVLGALGRTEEMIERACHALVISGEGGTESDGWGRTEARFCLYLFGPEAEREDHFSELMAGLERGEFAFGCQYMPLVELATRAEHPDADWLERLGAVVYSDAPLETIQAWPKAKTALRAATVNPKKRRREKLPDDPYEIYLISPPVGRHVPLLLHRFGAWLRERERGALGWFDALRAEAVKGFSVTNRERLEAKALSFLALSEGSRLLLVERGEQPAAVVLLGSEGEHHTVANSLEEFLLLWAKGETSVDDLDDEDGAKGRKALGKWLSEQAIVAPPSPEFDFHAWLETGYGEIAASAPVAGATARMPTELMGRLGPKLRSVAEVVGRRADAPQVGAFVTDALGKKVPLSTSTESRHVEAPKWGVDLHFDHNVLNDLYPPITKTKSSFVPYLDLAWIHPNIDEVPLGVPWKSKTRADVEKVLGPPTGLGDEDMPYWHLELDTGAQTELQLRLEDEKLQVEIAVRVSQELTDAPDVTAALFVGYAASRGLLNALALAPHAELLNRVKARAALGSELVQAAMSRGLWASHLRPDPALHEAALAWFHAQGSKGAQKTLMKIFGKRKDIDGFEELKLDSDSWEAVDQITPAFDAIFSMFSL